jgi:hypothetical protein
MAGAFRREQMLDDGDGVGRSHADRLVEHEPAMDIALLLFWRRRGLAPTFSFGRRRNLRVHEL